MDAGIVVIKKSALVLLMLLVFIAEIVFASDINQRNSDLPAIAKAYFEQKDYNQVIQWCLKALDRNPQDSSLYVMLGQAYYNLGDLVKAIESFKKAVRIAPRESKIYGDIAEIYRLQGNDVEAIKWHKDGLLVNPGDAENYINIGLSYKDLGKYEEAIKWLKQGIKINPTVVNGYDGLGWVYEGGLGDHTEALKWFEAGLKANPRNITIYDSLGRLYSGRGEYKEAIRWLKKGLAVNPNDGQIYYSLGLIYEKEGRYTKAIKMFKRSALTEKLLYSCPYKGLGSVYKKMGDSLKAEQSILEAVRHEPKQYKGNYYLAKYFFEVGNLIKAKEAIEKALSLAINKNDLQQGLALKGFILINQSKYDDAERLFNNTIQQYGNSSATLAGLGHIYNSRKDYVQAKLYFEQALAQRGEGKDMALLGLGWINANQGRHKEAINYYQQIIKEEPLNILALLGMGNAYNWLQDYALAEKYFRKVLEIDKGNEYALAELGTVYLNKGNNQKSERLLEQSLKINNITYSCPYEGLGMVYLNQGKTKEAEANFKKAIAINPNIEYKKYNGLAKIYIQQGKIKEAQELLKKSIKNYPYDDEARQLLRKIS